MRTKAEIHAVYREHFPFVRRFIAEHYKRLQPADAKDVEQMVWMKIVRGWPAVDPTKPEAWLTSTIKHAVAELYRRKHAQKRDERRNDPLFEERDSGPVDAPMISDDDVPADFERFRTKKRVRLIATQLAPADFAIFQRMMRDWESVPVNDRRRVIAAIRRLLRIDETNEEAGRIVEGPSHCGRTIRRLLLDEDEEDEEAA
jgi:DNA-directed RNA polymerase specialized sigma24 family protein